MTEKGLSTDVAPDDVTHSCVSSDPDIDSATRMSLYEKREREFMEFVKESHTRSTHLELLNEEGAGDRPLSGLQCLLALTEILDRVAQLRVANYDLEQRIQVLQRFEMIAEVHNELHNAIFDINANGISRGKKAKTLDETDGVYLKRSLSVESFDTSGISLTRKDNHSTDDSNRHKSGIGKGSKLSETWGKVKDKLAPKDAVVHTPGISKTLRRNRGADLAGSVRVPLGGEAPAGALASSNNPAHFTQREINISPPQTANADFGGVWLGDDPGEDTAESGSPDFGGVWLGPPPVVHHSSDTQMITDAHSTESSQGRPPGDSKETLERHSSEPFGSRKRSTSKSEQKDKDAADVALPAASTISFDELQKNKNKDNQSPTFIRKKSSKLLAQAAQLLPGSEQKKVKKVDSANELPKEFRKKIEEWHIIKDTPVSPETADVLSTSKFSKGSKSKRFKSKRRGGVLKQRSKSADRVEAGSKDSHDEDFEEKLREWSVMQGYHASYYSDIRDKQRSAESIGNDSFDNEYPDELSNKIDGSIKGSSDNHLCVNTRVSSCTDSNSSLSPAVTVNSLNSAENLQTLYEISQSTDQVFNREAQYPANTSRKLSRSEETLNIPKEGLHHLQIEQSASATSSNIDLYARASDQSLEKHMSLYHVASESSLYSVASSEHVNTSADAASNILATPYIKDEVTSLLTDICNINNVFSEEAAHITVQVNECNESKMESQKSLLYDPQSPTNINHRGTMEETPVNIEQALNQHLSNAEEPEKTVKVDQVTATDSTPTESGKEVIEEVSVSNNSKSEEFSKPEKAPSKLPEKTLLKLTEEVSSEITEKYSPAIGEKETPSELTEKSSPEIPETSLPKVTEFTEKSHTEVAILDNLITEEPLGCQLQLQEVSATTISNLLSSVDIQTQSGSGEEKVVGPEQESMSSSADKTTADKVYDINSNITNKEDQAAPSDKNPSQISTTPLYLGTDVPLKLRLTSLALEYELENQRGQHMAAPHRSTDTNGSHKRTRSYEIFSGPSSPIYPAAKTPLHRAVGSVTAESSRNVTELATYNSPASSTRTQLPGGSLISLGQNHINKLQRSNIHRLKSADELIYEQSPLTKRKHYTRNAITDNTKYSGFTIGNRRDLFEKPKEGTVKKALSMFIDNGTFNTQFGTDFSKPAAKPEST